jgi:branched-chain amino acid transport system permease protein
LIALVVSGITYGAAFALVALGFLVLYNATGVINFAHGDLMSLGAYLAFWLIAQHHFPVVWGYVAALALMAVVGVVLERIAYAPLRKRPVLVVVVSTLGAATAIRAAVNLWQGAALRELPSPVSSGGISFAGTVVPYQSMLVVGVALVVIPGVLVILRRTSLGRQLRATADDREAAEVSGVNVRGLTILTFAASSTLAALAGIVVAPVVGLNLTFGFSLMLGAFAAAVLGGFGSVGGAVLAGVGLGLLQQVVGGYYFQAYSQSVPFAVMIIAIVIRPSGIFSSQSAQRL